MVEITVVPYFAGMVNHATMDEMVKTTDYFNFAQRFTSIIHSGTVMDREERLRREQYCATETIKERESTREQRTNMVRCLTPLFLYM